MKAKNITRKKENIYWFFRSMLVSLIIIFCAMFLILGGAHCYAVMQTNITGKPLEVLEQKNGRIILLGEDIGSADFLPDPKTTE